jgi:hypothetical protein
MAVLAQMNGEADRAIELAEKSLLIYREVGEQSVIQK